MSGRVSRAVRLERLAKAALCFLVATDATTELLALGARRIPIMRADWRQAVQRRKSTRRQLLDIARRLRDDEKAP